MNKHVFAEGQRVTIVNSSETTVEDDGRTGTIIKLSCPAEKAASGKNCWWIQIDNSVKKSYSEIYLEPRGVVSTMSHAEVVDNDLIAEEVVDYITLEMVCQAKKAVDKAHRDFVELLSKYQLQETEKCGKI